MVKVVDNLSQSLVFIIGVKMIQCLECMRCSLYMCKCMTCYSFKFLNILSDLVSDINRWHADFLLS